MKIICFDLIVFGGLLNVFEILAVLMEDLPSSHL